MNKKSKRFQNVKIETSGEELNRDQVHSILLGMMKSFHEFCVEHNIHYCLGFGSLLGAVRHKGFIPWDDDMDILMPRPDYERFIKFSRISDRFQIVTQDHDHGYYHPYAYAAIIDSETIMIEHGAKCPSGKGQFIDVFPVDGVSSDEKERIKTAKKIAFYSNLKGIPGIDARSLRYDSLKNFALGALSYILSPFDEMKSVDKIESLCQKVDFAASTYCGIYCFGKNIMENGIYPREIFDEMCLAPFENSEFYIPKQYDIFLSTVYGDYMELPPENSRIPKHDVELYYRKQHI